MPDYLIDTDLLFGYRSDRSLDLEEHRHWRDWSRRNEAKVAFSVLTVIELRLQARDLRTRGVDDRAMRLEQWAVVAELVYRDRLMPVSPEIVRQARYLRERTERSGLRPSPQDAIIAATALLHNMQLVTAHRDTISAIMFRLGLAVRQPR